MDLNIADRVALVTGGSSGIGLETVRILLAEGARVVSCARRLEVLEQTAMHFAQAGYGADRLVVQACDVTNDGSVHGLAESVAQRMGALDILVLNAGSGRVSTFADTQDADWEAEMALKVFSIVRPVRAFLPLLRKSDAASIVIVSSLLARQPEPHMVCTSAARAAALNLAKSLSVELAPAIRVNTVLLGVVNSGQWSRRFAQQGRPGESESDWLVRQARERHVPLQRLGKPEEPAAAVAFLASPRSGFTTGATLEISGGVSRAA